MATADASKVPLPEPSSLFSLALAARFTLAGKKASGGPAAPPANPLHLIVTPPALVASPGGRVTARLEFTVPSGWHISAFSPSLAVRLSPQNGLQMTVEYPKPGSLKQGKDVLQVYQGLVRIPLTISVAPDHKPGPLQVQLTVRSQSCNERFCSLPRTDSLTFPLTIR